MNTYSVKETANILGITERAVQKKCKLSKIRKKNNRYLINDNHLMLWRTKDELKERTNKIGTQLDIELESLKSTINELRNELKRYEIAPNERIEVFTNDDYKLFERRLKEWQEQKVELEHQEHLFNAEKKSLNELYEHYKSQFHYQQKQNEKVLEMHQKLIDLIGEQNKITIQRQVIEAVDKEVINKDNWKPK
jgi:predicted transcriptional regulator